MTISKYAHNCQDVKVFPGQALKSAGDKVPLLFQPLTLRSLTLKNRVVTSPMCMYSSVDGFASNYHLAHLSQFALHGVGLVIAEASAVQANGRISCRDLGIWKDEHVPALKAVTEFIKTTGCATGIQLAHAGRKGSTYPPFIGKGHSAVVPVGKPDLIDENGNESQHRGFAVPAPSAVSYSEELAVPFELSLEDIKQLIADFASAAVRCDKAGFDLVEIHAAHGYLVHQFLSPLSNKRTDAYGGSFENRTRLCVEVCEAVRNVWPAEKPIFIRFSFTDYAEGGWTPEETVKLVGILHERKLVDLFDCSSGGLVPHQKLPNVGPGYQVHFSEKVKRELPQVKTSTVGKITEAKQAEAILQQGQADLVMMAREFLRTPNWTSKAVKELGVEAGTMPQYARSKE